MDNAFDVLDFLEDNDGFKNKNGVVFTSIEGHVHIASTFPHDQPSKIISIEICGMLDVELFTNLFRVQHPDDLERATREQLYGFFDAGILQVNCLIDGPEFDGVLIFQRQSDHTTAFDEEKGLNHTVGTSLQYFSDFVQCASKYFLLQEGTNPPYFPSRQN